MARSRLHKRFKRSKRSNPASSGPRPNPPLFTELAEFIGPGFGGFAATRLLTRIAATQIAKHKPSFAKHAGAAASVSSFLAAWFLAHRVKALAKYHTPIVVGAGIAALQSIIQLYIPKLGWMVADASPQIAEEAQAKLVAAGPSLDDIEPLDDEDPNMYTYNDSYDPGRVGQAQRRADQQAATAAASSQVDDLDDLDLQDVGVGVGGIFSN